METKMARSSSSAGSKAARPRSLGVWSRAFLSALAESCNVAEAARKAGITTTLAYDTRRNNAAFARKWQAALCEGYDNLEMELLHRLRSGELKPTPARKTALRSFDNANALRLLAAHREAAARQRAIRDNDDAAAVLEGLNTKLERMRERVLAAKKGEPDGE
jgi:shikimate kinase